MSKAEPAAISDREIRSGFEHFPYMTTVGNGNQLEKFYFAISYMAEAMI